MNPTQKYATSAKIEKTRPATLMKRFIATNHGKARKGKRPYKQTERIAVAIAAIQSDINTSHGSFTMKPLQKNTAKHAAPGAQSRSAIQGE